MPEDTLRTIAWELHNLVFDGPVVRDAELLNRLMDGGKAVARYLAECDSRADEAAPPAQRRACRTAQQLLGRGRPRSAVESWLRAQQPSVPGDPLEVLGHTTDPTLGAGILAAIHDLELAGELGTDLQPLPSVVPFCGRQRAVHERGGIIGRTYENEPDSLAHIFAWFLPANEVGRDLAELLQVQRHRDELVRAVQAVADQAGVTENGTVANATSGSAKTEAGPAGVASPEEPGAGMPQARRAWTQRDVDSAIREFKSTRARKYGELVSGVREKKAGAVAAARKMFGCRALHRTLGCSTAMVSRSPAWRAIAAELRLAGRTPGARGSAVGFEAAAEQKAVAEHREKQRQDELAELILEQKADDRQRHSRKCS